MALQSGFSPLNASTDTFSDWLNKTNEISALIVGDNTGAQTSIMTANASKSWTFGQAVLSSGNTGGGSDVLGEFTSNAVVIIDGSNTTFGGLQGGQYYSGNDTFESDTLYICTNTSFSNTANVVYVNATDKLHVTNNTEINQHLTVSNTGGYAFFHGNTHVEERFEVGSQTTGAVRSTTVDSLIVTGANVEWYDYSSNTTSSIRTNDNGDLIVDADVTGVGTANTTITLRVDNSDRATLSAANIDFYNAAGSTVGMRWTGSILELGEAQGFQIYNDTTDSFIRETSSGNLFVQANNLILEATDGTNYFVATSGANTTIHHGDGTQILEIRTDGFNANGEANTTTLRVRSDAEFENGSGVDKLNWQASNEILKWEDSVRATFGTGNDLHIFHDGSNSWIQEHGQGGLIIEGTDMILRATDDSRYLWGDDGVATHIYSPVSDTIELTANDSGIHIANAANTDTLRVRSTSVFEDDINIFGSGNTTTVTWDKSSNTLNFDDDNYITMGTGGDFTMYHEGSNTYIIENNASGDLVLQANNMQLEDTAGQTYFCGTAGLGASVHYNGAQKLITTNIGVDVTGLTLTDTLQVDGDSDLGASSSDTITFNAQADSNLVPTANGLNLGAASNRWDLLAETIDASSTLNVDGATTLNSTLDVDGATTLNLTLDVDGKATFNDTTVANSTTGSIQTDGGVSIAKNAYIVGNTDIDGIIVVDGNATFNSSIILGDGATDTVTFNADVNSNILPTANGLNLGAANDRWDLFGVTGDFSSDLNVDGNLTVDGNVNLGDTTSDVITVAGNVTRMVPTSSNNNLGISTKRWNLSATEIDASSTLDVDGKATFNNTTVANSTTASIHTDGGISIAKNAYISGNTDIDSNLTVDGLATFNGSISLGDAATDTVTFNADVNSNILPSASGFNLGSATSRWDLLGVTGDFTSTLNVDGVTTFNNNVTFDSGDLQWESANDTLNFNDDVKATFGDADDLRIYHNGTNSFIDDAGTGNLLIRSSHIKLQKYTGENMITGIADGVVTLYHNNIAKLATKSTGINVTGEVAANTIEVNESISANTISANGAGLTSLNADELTSGTVSDTLLPNNITSNITGTANTANSIQVHTATANEAHPVIFVTSSSTDNSYQDAQYDSTFVFNASNNTLTVDKLIVDTAVSLPSNVEFSFATVTDINVTGTANIDSLNVTSDVSIGGNVSANAISANGAGLTSLPAGQLTGTIADARLPNNITSNTDGTSKQSNTIQMHTNSTNSNQPVVFAAATSGYQDARGDSTFTFNPSNNTLSVDKLIVSSNAALPNLEIDFIQVTDINVSGTANIQSLEVGALVANGAALVGSDGTVTTTSGIIDTFPMSDSKGLKYIVQGERSDISTAVYGVEIMLIHNGSSVFYTRYGEIDNQMNDVEITPAVAANGTHVTLTASCPSASVANTHTFNIVRIETR